MILFEEPTIHMPPVAVKAIRKQVAGELRRVVETLNEDVPSHWGPGRPELEAEHFADRAIIASLMELRVRLTQATFLLHDLAIFDAEGHPRADAEEQPILADLTSRIARVG
jgi:hypothetical protein